MIFDDKGIDMSIVPNHDDPLLVRAFINNKKVHRLLVGIGSSTDLMFYDFFRNLKIPQLELLPYNDDLIGFSNHHITPIRYVKLHVTFGNVPITRTIIIRFIVVKLQLSYNAILGITTFNTLRALISTIHLDMKFLSDDMSIITLKGDKKKAYKCYKESLK